ncbi:MAG TPA: glycosyltransferase family 39 protein [Solirubrobacteraceae bacterium]|nr:glycosyltransferase family 39 protein [Solirubrobacteraceae bacterium]
MRGRLLVAAILALALTLRLGLALLYDPPRPTGDAVDYELHAIGLAELQSYPASRVAPGSSAFRPPGYPVALAVVYEVFGQGEDAPRVFGAVVGTVAVGLLGIVALLLFGRRAALVAMAIAAVFPPLVMVSVATLSEGLFVALVLGALACALAARRDPGRLAWVVAAGALAGAAALTRTNGLVILLPLVLAVPHRRLVLLAAALVVIAPWTIRNATELGAFVPTTTQAGFTLAGAYNDEARDDERFPAAWRPPTMPPYDRLPFAERYANEAEVEGAFRDEALEFAADHPLYVPRVVLWATVRMLNLADAELEELSAREAGVREGFVKLNRYATWVLLVAAVAGAVVARPPPWFWLFPVLLWLSVAIAIGATRYRTPVDPFLILLAACAATSVRWRRA